MDKIRVLADMHHSDLAESLAVLFEDRFGWELYYPIGMEYYDANYWIHERAVHGSTVASQYLAHWGSDKDCGDHFERDDWTHPWRKYKYVTLDQFRQQKWDIVLCSLLHNEPGYHRLAKEVGAKFVIQCGNQDSPDRYDLADAFMFSTTRRTLPAVPYVFYHQEFNIKDYYYPEKPTEKDTCCTWVQVLPASSTEYARFETLAKMTPELRWFTHGHYNGTPYWRSNVTTVPELARQMRASRVGVHFKRWSDGFGHVLYALAAVGKPTLVTGGYYLGYTDDLFPKLAGELMEDGVTCFDVDKHTNEEAAAFIRRLVNDDEFYQKMSTNVYNRFRSVVDFDADAEKVKKLLEGIM